jgi:hypothetical protein
MNFSLLTLSNMWHLIHWYNSFITVGNNYPCGNIPVPNTTWCSPNTHASSWMNATSALTKNRRYDTRALQLHDRISRVPNSDKVTARLWTLQGHRVNLIHPAGPLEWHVRIWCNIVQLLEHKYKFKNKAQNHYTKFVVRLILYNIRRELLHDTRKMRDVLFAIVNLWINFG